MSSSSKPSSKSKQPAVTVSAKQDAGSSSPLTILAIAVAGGIGYFAWKRWKQWKADEEAARKEQPADSKSSGTKGSNFSFDKPQASTSGRSAPAASQRPTRQQQSKQEKPKSQKQLRKEAKQGKKDAKAQAARDAEHSAVNAAIAKRAKELGMGAEVAAAERDAPQRYSVVDYEGVAKAMDRITEWQATGKKKY
ncbi:hypothetical protein HXX76_013874 [Chlamydomonas incerta]|uniref:Uncharacterized protein n=1 Tax=Chlamydomonas incerta TaxID=51695 RepID=A0A835VTI1_CHLIN|nr:hypothetical protein HXX76_013874 [Chlamydomonas incerta]|eukprot:KAG2425293.1 hypothetical protein HXX76_013874 [Chlamydomonas incerta]